jgi:hypothetical protein
MQHNNLAFSCLTFILFPMSASFAQKMTIPEQLAREGVDLGGVVGMPSGPAADVNSIIRASDLIVRGIVGEPKTYLSDDQMKVFSDYPIIKPAVLFDSAVALTVKPSLPEIFVTLEGGRIQVGALTFTATNQGLPGLQPGSDCLLLLKRVNNKLFIAGGHYGAFEVKDGKMVPLTQKSKFAPAYRGAPAASVIDTIVKQRLSVGK